MYVETFKTDAIVFTDNVISKNVSVAVKSP